MSAYDKSKTLCSWTNGRKANVYLVESTCGTKVILKCYRTRFIATLVREYLCTKYLSHRLAITPKVLGFNPRSRQLILSYIPGERVFEWVLARFGTEGIRIEDFRSYDYLDTCKIVAEAFKQFRSSQLPEALTLKKAIKDSYELLHRTGFVHGSADPRNVIYDGRQVFIIDFDHARPCLSPKLEYTALSKWYGIVP